MGILARADERVVDVKFTKDALSVDLGDGRTITVPLVWYPRLLNATVAQRKNWRVAGGGYGIHWPDIDEDLSTEGFFGVRCSTVPLGNRIVTGQRLHTDGRFRLRLGVQPLNQSAEPHRVRPAPLLTNSAVSGPRPSRRLAGQASRSDRSRSYGDVGRHRQARPSRPPWPPRRPKSCARRRRPAIRRMGGLGSPVRWAKTSPARAAGPMSANTCGIYSRCSFVRNSIDRSDNNRGRTSPMPCCGNDSRARSAIGSWGLQNIAANPPTRTVVSTTRSPRRPARTATPTNVSTQDAELDEDGGRPAKRAKLTRTNKEESCGSQPR